MPICKAKRIYTTESIQSWHENIADDWEEVFSNQEISLGKEIFRNGEIREIEVNETDAIVHAKFDQEECYALIEWMKCTYAIRGSSKDKLLVRALAAAGLYEIETILKEEFGDNEAAISKQGDGRDLHLQNILANRKKKKTNQAQVATAEEKARVLLLEFIVQKKGLLFKALWEEKKALVSALKSENYIPGETNASEREKLISLASLARRSGFKFSSKQGYYVLDDIEKIKDFYQKEISVWGKRFKLDLDEGVASLHKGIQDVEIVVQLEGCDSGTLDFCWNMEIDDKSISPDHARQLIRKSEKPVMLPQIGLAALSKEKLELLAGWKRWLNLYPEGKIPRYLLFSLFGEEPVKLLMSSDLTKWRESLYERKNEGQAIPEFVRPYQRQGIEWMWHLCDCHCHGLLADEMGLGKTVQILSLLASRNIYDKPDLVVCPASVVPVWQKEVERFFPDMTVQVLKSGNDFFKCEERILWIASYTQLRMHKFLLEKANFGYAVLDEAQLIKNPDSKISQACMSIRSEHRLVLSGTPLENRYLDLWALFRFLMPGLLGLRRSFEDRINNDVKGKAREKLRKQIAPFVLRRTKKDVLKELPGKTEVDIIAPLSDIQRKEYQRLTEDGVRQLGEDIPKAVKERSLSFLTLLTRLRQTCCDPGLLPWMDTPLDASGKIKLLTEKLAEILANGHKIVVFSQFVSLLDRVRDSIKGKFDTPLYQLTGKTVDRAKPVDEFQSLEGPGVILVSLRAGGTGITLHSADYVLLMDPWWNPAVEEQAIDRVHRIGQEKPVFVYRMLTAGTIESRIQNLKKEKKGIFSGVLGKMTDISDIRNYYDSLSDLIALLPEDDK